MRSARVHTQGFTLIASLLMLLLLSGIAIGLLMMVSTEGKVGGTDLQNNMAYHAAEGGIEKMASDLSSVFQNVQSPSASQICNVSTAPYQPVMTGVTWTQYSVSPSSGCTGALTATWGQISSGPNQGLWAQIIPVNMLATAAFPGGQEVSMTRNAQVALIPVFQFGVFCEGDCGFFDSPTLDFNGRIHTNADLYLGVSSGATLTFHDKLEAYGNVVTEVLPNGLPATGGSWDDTGNVYIPTADGNCPFPPAAPAASSTCKLKAANNNPGSSPYGDGSVQGAGGNPPQSAYNGNPVVGTWNTFSNTTVNHELINGNYGSKTNPGTGAKKLSMPFVSGTLFPYEIIRRAKPLSDSTSLSQSREENLAQIHVLLSDDPAELPTGSVRLANVVGGTNPYGIATSVPATGLPVLTGTNSFVTYFAAATNGWLPDTTTCGGNPCPVETCGATHTTCVPQYLPADWLFAPQTPQAGTQTLNPAGAPVIAAGAAPNPTFALCSGTVGGASPTYPPGCNAVTPASPYFVAPTTTNAATWNLIDGYLYVEYKDASGVWHNVTTEWLGLGFARGLTSPTAPGGSTPAAAGSNPVNPDAILLLQEPADRNGDGVLDAAGKAPTCTNKVSGVCKTWGNPLPPEVRVDAVVGTLPYFGVTNGVGTTTPTLATGSTSWAATGQSISMLNWYPINFYDAREGEPRDTDWGNNSCTTNGVMNAVEIDVGNLKRWLTGSIGTSGGSVDAAAQNGYVLYFSDRRGMLSNAIPANTLGAQNGDSGLEDVVNSTSAGGVPDGVLEPTPAGHSLSPEDVNQNGLLDEWGTGNLGLGQWSGTLDQSAANTGQVTGAVNQNVQIIAAAPDNPYTPRINSCATTGRKNWVSGARHVLKLVDGALGNVPQNPTPTIVNGVTYHGGFTVASENPVYIQGSYNSNAGENFWPNGVVTGVADASGHSAASVIADAVTILSDNWTDLNSMIGDVTQGSGGNRQAVTTYYRVAVAAGKNMAFPFPSWENSTDYGFGTDGGIHNFLRFLEDWNGQTLNYGGSLVSLYYATYNTGLFKCCKYSVYTPPTRNYIFDTDFTSPAGLPPGTPMFRDVEALGYRQLFTTRLSGQ